MCTIDVDGNVGSQQQPPDGGDKGKQQRYNKHLRETLRSLGLVVKKQHQTRFEQKLLAAKEQVGAAGRCGWVCWGQVGGAGPQLSQRFNSTRQLISRFGALTCTAAMQLSPVRCVMYVCPPHAHRHCATSCFTSACTQCSSSSSSSTAAHHSSHAHHSCRTHSLQCSNGATAAPCASRFDSQPHPERYQLVHRSRHGSPPTG